MNGSIKIKQTQNNNLIEPNGWGIYAVPEAETLKISINLNKVLHIYFVSKR